MFATFLFFLMLASSAFGAQYARLFASDGQSTTAIVERVKEAKTGVILVHMLDRSAEDWSFFAEKMARAEVAVIAPDLRGHGRNAKDGQEFEEADYKAMVLDVEAAARWLKKQGVTTMSCVGASIGANLCLQAAAKDADIQNVVMLSPGVNYKGVTSADVLGEYGARGLLLVASVEDKYSARSAGLLEERAKGQVRFELLENAGHGTKMLNREASLEGLVMSWVLGTHKIGGSGVGVGRPKVQLNPGKVETTGPK